MKRGIHMERSTVLAAAAVCCLLAGGGCATESPAGGGHSAKLEPANGPHGGRRLRDGPFGIEVTIFERGVPPELRVYCSKDDAPADCAGVRLTIDLVRFGGRTDTIRFTALDDYLRGDRTVDEPHSFEVKVVAEEGSRTHRWEYSSPEGRTELSPAAVQASGIVIETAGSAEITTTVRAFGRVVPNGDRVAHVTPRYAGVVTDVRKRLGDRVDANEVVALVESNESLRRYEVRSAIAGTVIEKDVTPGELAREGDTIYTVADLQTVWVDVNLQHDDFRRLRLGQTARVEADGGLSTEGRIVYLSPVGAATTQTLLARVEIPNPDGTWRPGFFATADVAVDRAVVPVAVRPSALQTFRDWDVVFLTEGNVFQAMPVTLGRRDEQWVEIVEGVAPGQRYAADGSFVVKADIGKSGAVHEH